MSKKKSSSMTLKDFHGGTIPSDIALPSAPGVITRPIDRPGSDRQGSWGSSIGRPDQRLRPSSSGSKKIIDDSTPFLTNNVHIGRNFDEDERKPLDGSSVPRRIVSDDPIGAPPMRMEPKSDAGRSMGYQGSAPFSQQAYSSSNGPYSARVSDGVHRGSTPRNSVAGYGVSGGTHPNAWAARKEVAGVVETAQSPYVGQSNVSKFAHASALDKVSSGRWQTKPVHHQADVEVIRHPESPNGLHPRGLESYNRINSLNERDYGEKMFVGRDLALDESVQIGGKEAHAGERTRSPVFLDVKERASGSFIGNGPPHLDGKYGVLGPQVHAEASERPKLKLLPRSKPLETPEVPPAEYKQKIQQASDSTHMELSHETIVNDSHVKSGLSAVVEDGKQHVERPKLNLKPRSQSVEKTEETAERPRLYADSSHIQHLLASVALFGGARPRELVLKERGVDDVVSSQDHVVQSPVRAKKDSPPANERPESANLDRRTGKGNDRREQRTEPEKTEAQKKNWRNENWRNSRDAEKQQNQAQHQQQQQQQEKERPASPETWRKPVEQPKPAAAAANADGLRFGKAVSAVELAQAFSKSVSDPNHKTAAPFSSPKGIPARTQVPFSRLAGSTSRPQLNGY